MSTCSNILWPTHRVQSQCTNVWEREGWDGGVTAGGETRAADHNAPTSSSREIEICNDPNPNLNLETINKVGAWKKKGEFWRKNAFSCFPFFSLGILIRKETGAQFCIFELAHFTTLCNDHERNDRTKSSQTIQDNLWSSGVPDEGGQ